MKKNILNIALLGMNEKNTSTFAYFLKKHVSQYCQLSTTGNAQAFIVEYDSPAGKKQWQQLCNSKQIPSILVATENPQIDKNIWIGKPVNGGELKKAILALIKLTQESVSENFLSKPQQLSETPLPVQNNNVVNMAATRDENREEKKRNSGYSRNFKEESSAGISLSKDEIVECCGQQGDIDYGNSQQRKLISYEDQNTLLNPMKKAVTTAKEKNCVVQVEGLHTPIVIMPGGESVYIDINNRAIRHICAMPLQVKPKITIHQLSPFEREQRFPLCHKNMKSTESVLWQIALWTSRGRLPRDINPEQSMKILHWPNLTRLQLTPHALSIVALWVNHRMSPFQVAENLNIPQRYVFSLASAVGALNLFSSTEGDNGSHTGTWKKSQGLFNSILRSLHIAA